MELFPDALDRISDNIMSGITLVPALGNVGFKSIVNGPTIWTGDSLARVGRTKIPGWYDFNSLTYGIAQSLSLAEYLSHIMLDGEQVCAFFLLEEEPVFLVPFLFLSPAHNLTAILFFAPMVATRLRRLGYV
jgi:hypothetical protein